MELEQARGISITSTALQFDYQGVRVNLLDTPGHQDFSEDTYRTLTAVDSAIMVIDASRGIQASALWIGWPDGLARARIPNPGRGIETGGGDLEIVGTK
jgi:hypothetical protein